MMIVIDEEKIFIKEDGVEVIDSSKNERLDTLMVLFSLKDEWEHSNSETPMFSVFFDDGNNSSCYDFDLDSLPSNWFIFYTYLVRLVGSKYAV